MNSSWTFKWIVLLPCMQPLGCGPSADAPLPPETDLHAYCLAVARKAMLGVPGKQALGLFQVGRVEERFGLEDKALGIYAEALGMDPDLGEAYRRTGFILSQRNDRMAEAVAAFQQSLRCDPAYPGVHTRLGLIFLHQNKLDEAVRAFQEEIRSGTASEDTHHDLGEALAQQGKHAEAVEHFKKAIEMAPDVRGGYYGLAQSLMALGKSKESQDALRKYQEIKKKEDEAAKDPTLGSGNIADQKRWTAETWVDAGTLYMHGASAPENVAKSSHFQQEFVTACREAIRFCPDWSEPREILVEYYNARQDFVSAGVACEEALNACPTKRLIARAYELAGRNIEGPGAGKQSHGLALRLLQKFVEFAPQMVDGHRELSKLILHWMSDRKDLLPQALTHAEKAVEIDPSAPNYDILAFAYLMSGKPRQARQALEEGLSRHPGDDRLRDRLKKFLEAHPQEP
jgi:tetratricopeptide (TPR) repeat protein